MEKVRLHIENEQAWLVINRPEKRNAIDYDVMEQFAEKLTIVEQCDDAKVLIITGQGTEAFCSGGDLSVFHSIHTKSEANEMLQKMAKVLERVFFFPKPTIAYLNGTAVGGGCEIATACDYRIAEKNIKMGFIQGRLGITTGWGGSTYLLEQLNQRVALELLLTARVFDAEEALQLGFIHKICDRLSLSGWISEITKQPLGVIVAYKNRHLSTFNKKRIKENVQLEIDDCSTLWETDEHHEAVKRFINK